MYGGIEHRYGIGIVSRERQPLSSPVAMDVDRIDLEL